MDLRPLVEWKLHSGGRKRHNEDVKKRGLSIRYKVLILLTALPLVTLSAYLILALGIFEKDKIAYVFDTSSSMSGTVATQIKTQLNSTLTTCRPIFQDYLNQEKFTQVGETIFQNEFSIESISVFKKNEAGVFESAAVLEKEPGQADASVKALGSEKEFLILESAKGQRLFRVPFKDDRGLLVERVRDEKTLRENLFFVVIKLNELAEMFKSEAAQKMYLVNQSGKVLLGPQEIVGQDIQSVVTPSFIANSKPGGVAQGAETKLSVQGEELLVSFSKTGFADLFVVSTVAKETALGAVAVLIRKSLIFFGVLVSITTIISLFASNTLTSALTALFAATKRVAEGDFNIQVKVSSNDEVGELADNFSLMAAEVSRLLEQTAEKARMENELQTARTVQETLFPMTTAQLGSLSIAGHYEPASECGGDWWHYCQIGDKYFFWIGDATGHGVPAALITSAAKSAATIIETLNVGPDKGLELLNRSIYDVSKGRIMMTFFLACYDPATGKLSYSNASHEGPYLLRNSGQELKKKDLMALNEVNNPRLGQARDTQYKQVEVDLLPGDTIFFYTDGIPDVQNPNKESWGEREFIKTLIKSFKDFPNPEEGVQRFVVAMNEHRQGTELIDDVTFFVIKNS